MMPGWPFPVTWAALLPPPPEPSSRSEVDEARIAAIALAIVGALLVLAFLARPYARQWFGRTGAVEEDREPDAALLTPPSSGSSDGLIEALPEAVQVMVPQPRAEPSASSGSVAGASHSPWAPGSNGIHGGGGGPRPDPARFTLPPPPDDRAPDDPRAGIEATVRELLACANAGQPLSGFALYTEAFFRRFVASTGLSSDEFLRTFEGLRGGDLPCTELAAIGALEPLGDDRLAAVVTYAPSSIDATPDPERYVFVRSEDGRRWLIDDIGPVADPAPVGAAGGRPASAADATG